MNSFSILKNRQLGLFAVVGALLLALILPSIVAAAQLTERSVAITSASKSAPGVSYTIKFKSVGAAGAVLIDFCNNTPLIGEPCTAPTGFTAVGADNATTIDATASKVIVTQAVSAATATEVVLTGITNPSQTGPLYARIITYNNATNAALYNAEQTIDQDSNRVDEGGAAIYINNNIGVSGAVLESMSFCVSGVVISDNCGGVSSPTLRLGEQVGDAFALVPGTVSQGSIYTQISTNAATGAVVSLKSNTTSCGGLVRAGAPNCDIAPAQNTDIAPSSATAKFGVKTSAAINSPGGGSGIFQPAATSIYNPTTFALRYVDNTDGVTSPYGSPFLDTAGAPVNNKNMQLTFGATVTNDTPAGLYSADLSLIATGKF